ncbi:MAG TPA: hypothetical protein DCO72_04045 [Ruminococcus sp.]|nr:hypothetical protein [Ruminococcus sp.]
MKKILCLLSSFVVCASMAVFPVFAKEEVETAPSIGAREHIDFVTAGDTCLRLEAGAKNCYVQFRVNEDVLGKITKNDFSSGAVTVKAVSRETVEIPEEIGEVDYSPYYWYRLFFDVTSDIPDGTVLFTFNFPDTVSGDETYFKEITFGNSQNTTDAFDCQRISTVYVYYYAYGDVNHDEVISISDVLALNQYLLGVYEPDNAGISSADVNHDGNVDDADSMMLLKSLVGLETLE